MDLQRLLTSVKRHEGFRSEVYKDSLGYDTIGYGTTIKDLVLSEPMASILCEQELFRMALNAYQKFPWLVTADPVVQEVLIEMSYQLGITGVSKFKRALIHLTLEEYDKAADELLDSKWARSDSPQRALELSNRIRVLG